MGTQTAGTDVTLFASGTLERSLVIVHLLVQFQVNVLREFFRALIAGIWFLTIVQSEMRFQIARTTESTMAYFAFVRLFS